MVREKAHTGKRSGSARTNLHGTAIDQKSIELLGGFGSGVGLAEDDRGNATAGAILVVGEHHLFDGSCRLGEVFLYRRQRRSVYSPDSFS